MSKEVVFGITDGSWIYAEGAKHFLWLETKNFDIYMASNARQTMYVIIEHPEDRDLLLKFTSMEFQDLSNNALEKYINAQLPEILETLK